MSTANGKPAETLILIDAHALIFQSFHAIPAMMAPDGQPTNALFGFSRDLIYIRDEMKPTYLVCAFDTAEPTFRSGLYPDYKAHRAPPPDDLVSQLPRIQEMIAAFNLPVLALDGFEADDLIATVSAAACERNLDVLICTSDKDCRQLLRPCVRMYNLRKREPYDHACLDKDWGVTPEQVVDFQSLVGDSVDNVPGVPGIGPKTASKLLKEFGTLDNLLARLEELPKSKMKENLIANAEKARLSRELVRLKTDVPMPLDWDNWRVREWDAPRLLTVFEGAGFRSLSTRVRASIGKAPVEPLVADQPITAPARPKAGSDLFSDFTSKAPAAAPRSELARRLQAHRYGRQVCRLPQAASRAKAICDRLGDDVARRLAGGDRRLGDHVESRRGLLPAGARPGGLATARPGRSDWRRSQPILEDPAIAKVNQNIKYDWLVLRPHGVALAGVAGDPMVADYLLHSGERSHSLDDLARQYLNHENIPITDLIGKKARTQLSMDQVPTGQSRCEYAGEDADVAWRLAELLEAELRDGRALQKLY